MSLLHIFLLILVVLIEFFLIGLFFSPILRHWLIKEKSISAYLEDARGYIYKICSFLCILFFITAFVLLFAAAYMQNPAGKNFITAVSLILFGLFFSSLEGMAFYLGFTVAKHRLVQDVTGSNNNLLSPSIFVLFFIGSTTFLSYPFVMIAQWITTWVPL
ncbi:MAG: hypothetical protein PHX86_08590 [Caldisericia bacterium]|nr:hypothetical protein [Caldisericia bacterium]